jgi:hypothetical protein
MIIRHQIGSIWTYMIVLLISSVMLVALATPAYADRIDGHWCFKDGRSFSIQGPKMITPAGTKMRGDYDRHGFSYIVPKGEPGAGDRLVIVQQDDTLVLLWRNKANAGKTKTGKKLAPEEWRRCDAKMS